MPANIVFVENKPAIDYMLKSPYGDVGMYMRRGAIVVQNAARAQVGVGTGRLKASIGYKQERTALGQKVTIGSSLSHALLHHEGTKPHVITAKPGGMLRFTRGSRVVYRQAVVHPSTRPNPYLTRSLPLFFTVRG